MAVQQSLITRLRAVEEALEDSIIYIALEGRNEDYAIHKAALSDLHELIKESEGNTCEDEGCPHYGTPHSHGKKNRRKEMTNLSERELIERAAERSSCANALRTACFRRLIAFIDEGIK